MKRILFQWLFVCLCATTVQAHQHKNTLNTVHISGQIKGHRSDVPDNNLSVIFWKDHIYGNYLVNSTILKVNTDKNGKFDFALPAMDHMGRVTVYIKETGVFICDFQAIEPGDDIKVSVSLAPDDTKESIIRFSGKGAAKYEANRATSIDPFKDYASLWNLERDPYKSLRTADSLLQKKLQILEGYKEKLSPEIYSVMKTDLIGKINSQMILVLRMPFILGNPDLEQTKKLREVFEKILNRLKKETTPEAISVLSANNIEFLYEVEKLKLVFLNNSQKFEFKDLYFSLRDSYSNILREKLLAYCLYNTSDMAIFFGGIKNPDDYTNCLKDALKLVRTPYLKQAIETRLDTRGKGATPFNFNLPADSSGRMVSLSDLKGKVVLVDIWGYICTGCYTFSQAFHEKLYPLFKDNPNFAVVSIMFSEVVGMDKYMRRLRGEGTVYTFPDYINLYAGKEIKMGKLMSDHYNMDAVPFLLLVDKNGKIFSSTLPFFNDTKSDKIDELKKLIEQALNTN